MNISNLVPRALSLALEVAKAREKRPEDEVVTFSFGQVYFSLDTLVRSKTV